VVLDGESLTLPDLARVARDPRVAVEIAPVALERVRRGWRQIEGIAHSYREGYERFVAGDSTEPPVPDYGVTTGFGEFKDIPVAPDRLEELQRNILLSHSVGIGESADPWDPASFFPADVVRAALLIRLNAFLRGHSGVREELVAAVLAMVRRGIVPRVPVKGSLGSSGDLCPLAHLFAVLVGSGAYRVVRTPEEVRQRAVPDRPAAGLVVDLGAAPPAPSFKEGLALVNGATFSVALLALAVADAADLAAAADVAAALTLEALCGCARAFDPKVQRVRGLPGQRDSAANLRRLVAGSRLVESAGAVQDPYSMRCAPAVHGATRDAIAYAAFVARREVNAATDNPLFFPGEAGQRHAGDPFDLAFRANWPAGYRGDLRSSYSAGNFHGQPVGLAADFLAIAVAELADIAERRTQMLLDQHHNRGLPANLIPHRGVQSGLMLAQYSAASVVAENKVLAHPATVDSIPSAANSEDHVAMSTLAARKLRTVLANTQAVIAVELLTAAQAVDWRVGLGLKPRLPLAWPGRRRVESAEEAEGVWRAAEDEAERFRAATAAEAREAIAGRLGRGTAAAYRAVRAVVPAVVDDRPLDEDIRRLREIVAERSLLSAVEEAVGELTPVAVLEEAG
jgi:histidine ammonia-lyase